VPVPGVPAHLEISPGEHCALVVPDRRQARWLADLVTGLEQPPAGARVEGADGVRLVPADGGLLPHLTVLGNLMHGARVSPGSRVVPRSTAEQGCRETASRCGLDDVLERYPYEITPGRRRLAGLARALRSKPAAVVLEDAPGLPTWGALLDFERNPELLAAALLLITGDPARAAGFPLGTGSAPDGAAEPGSNGAAADLGRHGAGDDGDDGGRDGAGGDGPVGGAGDGGA
jgi:ABC-type taurine transport system ATPase subunit